MTNGRNAAVVCLLVALGGACQKKDPVPALEQTKPAASVAAVGSSGNAPAALADCEVLCQRTVELNCKSTKEQCKSRCSEMAQLPVCPTEMSQVFQCLKTQATAHFECDDEGMPAIRSGFCEAEQAAFAKCVSKGAPSP